MDHLIFDIAEFNTDIPYDEENYNKFNVNGLHQVVLSKFGNNFMRSDGDD